MQDSGFIHCPAFDINMIYFLLFVAVVLGVIRFFISPTEPTWLGAYKDAAHLFVGGLIGGWMVDRSKSILFWVAVGLSILELTCFILGRI